MGCSMGGNLILFENWEYSYGDALLCVYDINLINTISWRCSLAASQPDFSSHIFTLILTRFSKLMMPSFCLIWTTSAHLDVADASLLDLYVD